MKLIDLSQMYYKSSSKFYRIILTYICVLFVGFSINAQDKFGTKSGDINFEASVSNFEPVAAKNNTVSAILKENGDFAALVLIKGFKFEKGLMEEHFNQKKFMDSKNFPKAKFLGKIDNFIIAELTETFKKYTIKGKLTVKEITKEIETMAEIKIVNGDIFLNSNFSVEVADFNIAVKSSVAKKIAKTVNIEVDFNMKK